VVLFRTWCLIIHQRLLLGTSICLLFWWLFCVFELRTWTAIYCTTQIGLLSCVLRNAKNHGVYCDRIQKLGLALILSWHRYTRVLLLPIYSRCTEYCYFCLYTVYSYWTLLEISCSWTKTKPNCQQEKINSYLAENMQSFLLRITGKCCQRNNLCFSMRTILYIQIRVGRI